MSFQYTDRLNCTLTVTKNFSGPGFMFFVTIPDHAPAGHAHAVELPYEEADKLRDYLEKDGDG